VTEPVEVFLSYSRNDRNAAALLHTQLKGAGLSVFKDDKSIRWSDAWLDKLQDAVDGCGAFVVLVGRDGVRRWIGAETQVALNRYFGPHDDKERLPIFPILLDGTEPDTLPAFLRLFQARPWNGREPLPDDLLQQIRARIIVANDAIRIDGCPYVGLAAYTPKQAHLFFGRQKETLDALSCFNVRRGSPPVRWLEINGNSGSGKSSLMNAGILPLIDQGWLWRRTRVERWIRIGPMMPGVRPVDMLAEHLARAFSRPDRQEEMADIRHRLESDDERALADWLRGRQPPDDDAAFLLALDQFEELFTFAEEGQRCRFDRLLAAALDDPDCPLFVISTVRADFLDRFEVLPWLVAARNRIGKFWTLGPMGGQALREVIDGPARLANLDASEVRDWIVAEAEGEPGALPLVENALEWLWWEAKSGNHLSGQRFRDTGGIAGILVRSANDLLDMIEDERRILALELLFRLVKVDLEGYRHARRRLPFAEAVDTCGGGEEGRRLIYRLAGGRAPGDGTGGSGLRLITVMQEDPASDAGATTDHQLDGRWVNLIHETLIRSKGLDAAGKPQPYWQTLWNYIEQHKEWAAWRERLQADMQTWLEKEKAPGFQWSHERVRELHAIMQRPGPKFALNPLEREFVGPTDPDEMLVELERPETTHKRRLLIGERLDILGDPRPGIDPDAKGSPQIDWCLVTGGEVAIQVERRLLGGTKPHRKTVEPFQIARYPITVAQYRAFILAEDGWRDPAWWGEDLYREEKGNTFEFGRFANHPAVYVSWFDAMAFCRWLSRRVGFLVRLPDEWEWQQAATGGDAGNVFPWGPDWDPEQEPWRANTFESRLGQLTAVGMYPAGVSPVGALDMGGTVWEWCLNKFKAPEVTRSGARDFDERVLRGGSWVGDQVNVRAAYRNRLDPSNRDYFVGFRVVCSSPSFGR
jgi:formylglycine-generating enzyme required for sulfatase activity